MGVGGWGKENNRRKIEITKVYIIKCKKYMKYENNKNIIQDRVYIIREFVTQRRIQDKLLENKPFYLQLCSCMDTVSDNQQAIDAYVAKIDETTDNIGEVYLQVYGLLQSIFVQQDASIDMAKSLNITDYIRNYPALFDIREIRNQIAGHPTNYMRKNKQGQSYNTIIQCSLTKKSFEILSYDSQAGHATKKIKVANVIHDQQLYIVEILDKILNEIKKRDKEYRLKFKDTKISECFTSPDVFYCCEKTMEALISGEHAIPELGKFGIGGIESALKKFAVKLEEREIKVTTYPGVEIVFNDCKYPLEKLNEYFSCLVENRKPSINNKTAGIFSEYLRSKVKELFEMAKEIDEEYSS